VGGLWSGHLSGSFCGVWGILREYMMRVWNGWMDGSNFGDAYGGQNRNFLFFPWDLDGVKKCEN